MSDAQQKRKVLVVEDDKFLGTLFVRKLLSEGFDVNHAIDATTAYALLEKSVPEIILLDLILPGEDGFSILGKIKQDDRYKHVPVIVFSNLGQKEDIDRTKQLGAIDFMVKANFTLDEVVTRVRAVLATTPPK
jgi:DNA-binding response OmpR family regulator